MTLHPAVQCGLVAFSLAFSILYWAPLSVTPSPDFGGDNIAIALQPFKSVGYSVASTEAGALPYFSEWRAIDLYGLNDQEIVHDPHGLTQAYLQLQDPAVILYHQTNGYGGDAFNQRVAQTKQFISAHHYTLAAAWGYDLCDRQMYFVKNDLPQTSQFVDIIRRQPYVSDSKVLVDLRDTPRPANCATVGPDLRLSK